jgi:predicted RNA-binding protein
MFGRISAARNVCAGLKKRASKEENQMCEANAYLINDKEEELLMSNVDILRPEPDGVYIRDIFGEQRWIKAHIKEMNLVQHRIVLEKD